MPLAFLGACTASDAPYHSPPAAFSGGEFWAGPPPDLDGTLYVLAGPKDISRNVVRVDLASGAATTLTDNPENYGVSTFSASPAGLALASAESGVDQLRVIGPPWEGTLSEYSGSSPSIDQAGRVLLSRGTDSGSAIDLYSPQGVRSVLWKKDRLDPTAVWGPAGTVLLASPTEGEHGLPTTISVLDQAGDVVRRVEGPGGPFELLPNPYPDRQPVTGLRPGWVRGGLVFNEDLSKVTRIPSGWTAGCWQPDGKRLLVSRRREVGLWELENPFHVKVIGETISAVRGCAWLTRPAPGTTRPQP